MRFIWLAFIFLLSGCLYQGPGALRGGRLSYNMALQQSSSEQMLLNLVRLRYRDNPVFLEVNSISTQLNIGAGAQAGVTVRDQSPETYTTGLNFSYAEKPTITFVPLQGEKFVERLFSPIPVQHLILLYHSGWNVARIFKLCVQQLNDLQNAPSASGPTPRVAPTYRSFFRAVALMRALQKRRLLDFVYRPVGNTISPGLYLPLEAQKLPEGQELLRLLNLEPGISFYPITTDMTVKAPNTLRVESRALIGILFYLSHGVEVPPRDKERGLILVTVDRRGKPFDWANMLKGLFLIKTSSKYPVDAAVAVRYRGKWFYIDDRDLETKSTFMLLSQLFALEAGKSKSIMPMLTIPIGQ